MSSKLPVSLVSHANTANTLSLVYVNKLGIERVKQAAGPQATPQGHGAEKMTASETCNKPSNNSVCNKRGDAQYLKQL